MTGTTYRERGARERVDRREESWGEATVWYLRATTGLDIRRPRGFNRLKAGMSDLLGIADWAVTLRAAYRRDWPETMRLARNAASDDGLPYGAAIVFRKGRTVEEQLVAIDLDTWTRALTGQTAPSTSASAQRAVSEEPLPNKIRGMHFRRDVAAYIANATDQSISIKGGLELVYFGAGSLGTIPGWSVITAADLDERDYSEHLDSAEVAAAADRNRLAAAILQRHGMPSRDAIVLMTLRSFAHWIGEPR